MAASAICKIKHEAKSSAILGIKAVHRVLELGHALAVLKDLPINALKTSPSLIYRPSSTFLCLGK